MTTFQKCWVERTREVLLNIERRHIFTRSQRWSEIVNKQTINLQIEIFGGYNSGLKFNVNLSNKEMNDSLQFLYEWKGLNPGKPPYSNIPKTINEYQSKSKNWSNGRRAKIGADTIFPLFIIKAENFAQMLAQQTFIQPRLSKLYFQVLMYTYLRSLCESKVMLNGIGARVRLICDNSLRSPKSKLKRILQSYAADASYPDTFPAHRQYAVDYFTKQYDKNKAELIQLLNVQQSLAENKEESNGEETLIINPFNDVFGLIQQLITTQNKQEFVISDVVGRVTTLEQNTKTVDNIIDTVMFINENWF